MRRPAVCRDAWLYEDLRCQVIHGYRIATTSTRQPPRSQGAKSGSEGKAREEVLALLGGETTAG